MITIIYSTHKDETYNSNFKKHLLQSVGLNNVQILEYVNKNEYSLSEIYNKGISESTNDIIVCCHNDIKLEKGWGKKLMFDFENNPEYGIIGKAGSCYFSKSGVYWEKLKQTMVGQVYHYPPNQKKFLSRYSPKLPIIVPVITIDGVFMSFNKQKIKHFFDESYGKFHFYDHGFTIPNYLDGVKIGVTSSFDLTHESVGQPNVEFYESKKMFLNKWGEYLPLDLKPTNVYVERIKPKKIKMSGKVGVIIPTKGKINILFDCIKSFYEHCNENVFDIFIADTGSSDDEKNKILDRIKKYKNIKFIEYDYYNFAKINNDVVKNHITNKHEYLLFCNNDIKIMNDVISGMLDTFDKNGSVGSVGCRLHFNDNTIQHDGIFVGLQNNSQEIRVGHLNFKNYYNFHNKPTEVFGNTAGLMLIRKNTFEKVGMFNEEYMSCYEDVELNLTLNVMGYKNYICGHCVAYHYESQTRNEDYEDSLKSHVDFSVRLKPLVLKNYDKIKNKLLNLI